MPEPRASAPFPGGADVNSFLPGGEEAICPAFLAWGARGRLAGGPDEAGSVCPRRAPGCGDPGAVDSRPRGRAAVSSGLRAAFAARILSLAPGLGVRSPEHLGPGRGGGAGAGTRRGRRAPRPRDGHVGPRLGW